MTRETKIGLLVGLAFIIVIGILLSDHLTSTTEPPQAQLAQAGGNVRSAVSTPGGSAAQAATVTTPTMIAPQQPVPTQEEMTPKAPPVQIVHIGPGATPAPPALPTNITPPLPTPPVPQNDVPTITRAPETTTIEKSALTEVAKVFNEQIVPVGPQNDTTQNRSQTSTQLTTAAGQKYKVEPGDSVSRLASRFMGGNTQANRDAIVKANPSLQQDANKLIIGRTYIIPSASPATPVTAPTPPAKPAALAAGSTGSTGSTAPAGEYIYTVKSGDSLSKIAVEQLGSATTIAAIKELNRDVLKDENTITPNMKLRLPAKPLASAQ